MIDADRDSRQATLLALLEQALAAADKEEEHYVAVLIAQAIDKLPPAR